MTPKKERPAAPWEAPQGDGHNGFQHLISPRQGGVAAPLTSTAEGKLLVPWTTMHVRLRDAYFCEGGCAGCGAHAIAYGTGWYELLPERWHTVEFWFDLCRNCAARLRRGGVDGEVVRRVLSVVGRRGALARHHERVERCRFHCDTGNSGRAP